MAWRQRGYKSQHLPQTRLLMMVECNRPQPRIQSLHQIKLTSLQGHGTLFVTFQASFAMLSSSGCFDSSRWTDSKRDVAGKSTIRCSFFFFESSISCQPGPWTDWVGLGRTSLVLRFEWSFPAKLSCQASSYNLDQQADLRSQATRLDVEWRFSGVALKWSSPAGSTRWAANNRGKNFLRRGVIQ